MSYYVIDQETNALLYVSDFEPPNEFVANGHHVYESPISATEINAKYDWSASQNTFILKDTKITKRAFIKRFTVVEYATIKTAAEQNPTLDYYWQLFMLAEYIDLGDLDTIQGVHMLEQVGLLGTGRAQEILNG
jgi:hypothetical protein